MLPLVRPDERRSANLLEGEDVGRHRRLWLRTDGTMSTANTYATQDYAANGSNIGTGTVADARIASTIARDSEVTTAVAAEATLARNADNLTSGTVAIARLPIDADVATLSLPA